MRVLVTGGAGFIGSHVLRFLTKTYPEYFIVCADALTYATDYVRALESRVGVKIGCIEEAALQVGFISNTDLTKRIVLYPPNSYRDYLLGIL